MVSTFVDLYALELYAEAGKFGWSQQGVCLWPCVFAPRLIDSSEGLRSAADTTVNHWQQIQDCGRKKGGEQGQPCAMELVG